LASLAIALKNRRSVDGREVVYKCVRLILALFPKERLVEVSVGIELLGEKTGLGLLGLEMLFGSGQVENQVSDDEGL
jgi:hypothetical protein